jgi:hypothetical protein
MRGPYYAAREPVKDRRTDRGSQSEWLARNSSGRFEGRERDGAGRKTLLSQFESHTPYGVYTR